MWICKHCNIEFDFATVSDKANHSRWCDKNPNRNKWNSGTNTINKYGKLKQFTVLCGSCDNPFVVTEREKLFPSKANYFCTRSCSNSIGGIAKREKYGLTGYVTIAEKFYHRRCCVCGTTDVLDVHHIDEDRSNFHPSNLIFLCPNDHARLHRNKDSKVLQVITGHGAAWGGHFTCTEDVSGVRCPDAPPNYFR